MSIGGYGFEYYRVGWGVEEAAREHSVCVRAGVSICGLARDTQKYTLENFASPRDVLLVPSAPIPTTAIVTGADDAITIYRL